MDTIGALIDQAGSASQNWKIVGLEEWASLGESLILLQGSPLYASLSIPEQASQNALREASRQSVRSSRRQGRVLQDVTTVLQTMSKNVELDARNATNLVPADLALAETNVAFVVEDSKSYTRNTRRPLGRALVNRAVLRGCGWEPVVIPQHIWETTAKARFF